MFKPIEAILFATNLNENCRAAFEFSASMAARYQAKLVLLNVIEKDRAFIEDQVKSLMGEKGWSELNQKKTQSARDVLIAKRPSSTMIKEAMDRHYVNNSFEDINFRSFTREIVVKNGEIADEITKQALKYNADLIVLGSREGFLTDNRIGQNIKAVMRKSSVPVLVVPPYKK